MSNFASNSIAVLEYHDPEIPLIAQTQPEAEHSAAIPAATPAPPTELEIEERVARARAEATSEAERNLHEALEQERQRSLRQVEKTLQEFSAERTAYFKAVERELLQLAVAIARKIIQRETQLDPTLLAGLIRIALDRMQSEGSVRLRVFPADAPQWHALQSSSARMDWTVAPDDALGPGDCIVETDAGSANFGFEAQLRSVEENLFGLMAQRPEPA